MTSVTSPAVSSRSGTWLRYLVQSAIGSKHKIRSSRKYKCGEGTTRGNPKRAASAALTATYPSAPKNHFSQRVTVKNMKVEHAISPHAPRGGYVGEG